MTSNVAKVDMIYVKILPRHAPHETFNNRWSKHVKTFIVSFSKIKYLKTYTKVLFYFISIACFELQKEVTRFSYWGSHSYKEIYLKNWDKFVYHLTQMWNILEVKIKIWCLQRKLNNCILYSTNHMFRD